MHVSFQIPGEHNIQTPVTIGHRELMIHIAIPVQPDTHLHLSEGNYMGWCQTYLNELIFTSFAYMV